ncbi:MAG: DUF4412 domain-containing protein [Vicingaceae bacterium]
MYGMLGFFNDFLKKNEYNYPSYSIKNLTYICKLILSLTTVNRQSFLKSIIRHIFVPIFLFSALLGCKDIEEDKRLSEGIIEYSVAYPKLDPTSILAELLPSKMTLTFKEDKFTTDLSAGFGMFRLNVISHGDEKEMSQMVKLINERFVVNYSEVEAIKSNKQLPQMEIEETGKTKKIAGYLCNEARVTVSGDSIETYLIYYTKDIRIDHPNWFTQMMNIDGVLLEYQVERYNLCSRFTATSVVPKEIDSEFFNVPKDYTEITEAEMNEKMEEIFNNFSE